MCFEGMPYPHTLGSLALSIEVLPFAAVTVFSSRADGVLGAIIANAMLCLSKSCPSLSLWYGSQWGEAKTGY